MPFNLQEDEPEPEKPSTLHLLSTALFQHHYEDAPRIEHLERSYLRAQALGRHHGKCAAHYAQTILTTTRIDNLRYSRLVTKVLGCA